MSFLDREYSEKPFYGVRRLQWLLRSNGYRINTKRLIGLMRTVRWKTLYPKRKTTVSDKQSYKYPYLLNDMIITHPNQVWAVDITYIPMKKGFMYLFGVIDLYSRYVVGWSLSNTMTADWCADTLQTAFSIYGCPEIINSDQGCQFTSDCYTGLLKEKRIKISMDSIICPYIRDLPKELNNPYYIDTKAEMEDFHKWEKLLYEWLMKNRDSIKFNYDVNDGWFWSD
jgi:putative transposase